MISATSCTSTIDSVPTLASARKLAERAGCTRHVLCLALRAVSPHKSAPADLSNPTFSISRVRLPHQSIILEPNGGENGMYSAHPVPRPAGSFAAQIGSCRFVEPNILNFAGPTPASIDNTRTKWRRERDSNPRSGYKPLTHFPGVLLQPLGHLSAENRFLRCRTPLRTLRTHGPRGAAKNTAQTRAAQE